jgi:hypothetical protein
MNDLSSKLPEKSLDEAVEDLGLSDHALIVLGHLFRTQGSPGSIKEMAYIFSWAKTTVRFALWELEYYGILLVGRSPGKANVYWINPSNEWRKPKQPTLPSMQWTERICGEH